MTLWAHLKFAHCPAAVEALCAIADRVVVGDLPADVWRVESVADIAQAPSEATLWLHGTEAAGATHEVTALTLMRAASRSGRRWVVEGLGPRGAAAALRLGAHAAVLDVPLWRTSEGGLTDEQRARLDAVRGPRDTSIGPHGRAAPALGPLPAVVAPQSTASWPVGSDTLDTWHQCRAQVQHHLDPEVRADDPFGLGTDLVQGPMANVAEQVGLARAVRPHGVLPFAALGALDPQQASNVLRAHESAAIGAPWGVGLIGFEAMPYRDAHLAALKSLQHPPTAVILAGAGPVLARELADLGLTPWLHCPSRSMAVQACERGVNHLVFEGREAGGHVGHATSVGLWEAGLEVLEAHGSGLAVLAGGIGDTFSACFARAMAGTARRQGVSVALQVGTAWFFTHEIVEVGQLTRACQQAALATHETVLIGQTTGLTLRCAPNRYSAEAVALEHQWLKDGLPLSDRRSRIEHHNLGRARLAAKGIERDPERVGGRRYRPVPTRRIRDEGAFTMGQGATVQDELYTIAQLVDRLTRPLHTSSQTSPWGTATAVAGQPRVRITAPVPTVRLGSRPSPASEASTDIAIVGLGCVVPGASDVPSFWRHLIRGRDAVGPVPEERWATHRYWDPQAGSTGPVKTYQRVGGFVQPDLFDPLAFHIPPRVAAAMDPAQRLALVACAQAVRSAGWETGVDTGRAAVVLGNSMGGEFGKSMALRVRFREVLAALEADGALDDLDPEQRLALFGRIEARLAASLPPVDVDSMPGLLGNVIAGRVASWLDWNGGNITVDAACAASLAALTVAVDWLRAGRCDLVLAGGVDTDMAPETYVGFSRTLALSRTRSTPFSTLADGFVMGEGAAVFALKRADDARASGDPIWAVIRGAGQSSDGRGKGITAPRSEGQRLAIRRAWEDAGVDGSDLGMIEAHGTGTVVGDRTEFGVLAEELGSEGETVWLGSVKSGIGHLKAAAGAAGLMKTILSLSTGIVPPTLHAAPLGQVARSSPRLRLPRYPTRFSGPRRAGVSAFGFGGTNFHLVVEKELEGPEPEGVQQMRAFAEPLMVPSSRAAWHPEDRPLEITCWAGESREALVDAVVSDRIVSPEDAAQQPWRCVAVCDPSQFSTLRDRLAAWIPHAQGGDSLGGQAFLGAGEVQAPVWLFPGQGSQRSDAWDNLGAVVGHPADTGVHALEEDEGPLAIHRVLVPLAMGWASVLHDSGLPLGAALGHSLGELGALAAAGRITPSEAGQLAEQRGLALESAPEGAMLAIGLPPEDAARWGVEHGLELAAVNDPKGAVLAGSVADVERAVAAAPDAVRTHRLRVARAFHTEAVRSAKTGLAEALSAIEFTDGAPVWTALSAAPMTDPAIELVQGLTRTVRFSDSLQAMAQAGHQLFVEVGPGSALAGRVRTTLPEATVIPLDPDPGDRGAGVVRGAAALTAAGHPGLLRQLPATWCTVAFSAPTRPPETDLPQPDLSQRSSQPVSRTFDDPVVQAVAEAVHQVTGYPLAFLDLDADLEGALGVDSIRKIEILGVLEDSLGIRARESDHGLLVDADIQTLVAWARERLDAPEEAGPTEDDATANEPRLFLWRAWESVALPEGPPASDGVTLQGSVWTFWPEMTEPSCVEDTVEQWRLAARQTRPEAIRVLTWRGVPATAAAAAFARCLGAEWGVPVHEVLAAPGADPSVIGRALAHAGDGPLHVQADRVTRWAPYPAQLEPSQAQPGPVWVTGGLAGLAGAILERWPPSEVSVLARRALDDGTPRAASHQAAADTLTSLGHRVHWHVLDLSNEQDINSWMAGKDPPSLILHAAGALADGPANTRTKAHQTQVLAPKIAPLDLLERTGAPVLALSSISALVGNPGQTLYAAANGALDQWPGPRLASVSLTAVSGRGMADDPTLLRLLETRGLTPMPVDAAADALASLSAQCQANTWPTPLALTVDTPPGTRELPWPLGRLILDGPGLTATIPLTPEQPWLDHHRVAGRPLVPAALWLSAMQAVSSLALNLEGSLTLDGFTVDTPTFVDARRDDIRVVLVPEQHGAQVTVFAGQHPVASACLGSGPAQGALLPPTPLSPDFAAASWYTPERLFHGPSWRVLTHLEHTPETALADVSPCDLDPIAATVDGVHQVLSAWSGAHTGWLTLPVGAARWVLSPVRHPLTPIRIVTHPVPHDDGVLANVVATDLEGHIVLEGTDVRLVRARPWEGDTHG